MYVSVILVRGLLSECQRRGIPTEQLLAGSSVDEASLQDLRATVPLEQWDLLLRRLLALSNDPALGLMSAQHAPCNVLQLVGQLVLTMPTMREAAEAFRRYSPLLCNHLTFDVEHAGAAPRFVCIPLAERPDLTPTEVEFALMMGKRVAVHFNGEHTGIEVRFQHKAPKHAYLYEPCFECPVHFGQERNEVILPRAIFDTQQLHSDPTMLELLREPAERLLNERLGAESFTERLRARLRYERDLSRVDLSGLARALGVTPRGLRRKLANEGITVSALVDEARLRVAQRELSRPDATIKGVAEQLGFSEPSAFHRAFKRWTGQTPAQFSRRRGIGSVPGSRPPPPRVDGAPSECAETGLPEL